MTKKRASQFESFAHSTLFCRERTVKRMVEDDQK
jgi:hypothetical protein